MLQLGGILINGTVRTTPRYSWRTTVQNLLSTSSMATKPNPEIDVKVSQNLLVFILKSFLTVQIICFVAF